MEEHSADYLFRMYKNGISMLIDRGYKVSSIETIEDFSKSIQKNSIYIYDDDRKIVLFISKNKKSFIKKDFENAIKNINKYVSLKEIVLFISIGGKIGTKILKYIDPDTMDKDLLKYNITFISTSLLLINIPKHNYVPKHELINDQEKIKNIMKNLNNKKEHLSKILETDPVALWYGARPGDIFKITRIYNNSIHDTINEINLNNNMSEIEYKEIAINWNK